jgi:single-strand DNA-binding protein
VASLNKIVVVGTLLDDPETRISVDGKSITKFRMTLSSFPGADQTVNFIDVVTWQRLAEICAQYLKKGKLVLVEGQFHIRSYEDQGGQRKWTQEVSATNMQMLDGKAAPRAMSAAAPAEEKAVQGFEEVEELPEDDLPF